MYSITSKNPNLKIQTVHDKDRSPMSLLGYPRGCIYHSTHVSSMVSSSTPALNFQTWYSTHPPFLHKWAMNFSRAISCTSCYYLIEDIKTSLIMIKSWMLITTAWHCHLRQFVHLPPSSVAARPHFTPLPSFSCTIWSSAHNVRASHFHSPSLVRTFIWVVAIVQALHPSPSLSCGFVTLPLLLTLELVTRLMLSKTRWRSFLLLLLTKVG